jgi:hypothetical protein
MRLQRDAPGSEERIKQGLTAAGKRLAASKLRDLDMSYACAGMDTVSASATAPVSDDCKENVVIAFDFRRVLASIACRADLGGLRKRNVADRVGVVRPAAQWDLVPLDFGGELKPWPSIPKNVSSYGALSAACLFGGITKAVLSLISKEGKLCESAGRHTCPINLQGGNGNAKSQNYSPYAFRTANGGGGDWIGGAELFYNKKLVCKVAHITGDIQKKCHGHPGNEFTCSGRANYGFPDTGTVLWCKACGNQARPRAHRYDPTAGTIYVEVSQKYKQLNVSSDAKLQDARTETYFPPYPAGLQVLCTNGGANIAVDEIGVVSAKVDGDGHPWVQFSGGYAGFVSRLELKCVTSSVSTPKRAVAAAAGDGADDNCDDAEDTGKNQPPAGKKRRRRSKNGATTAAAAAAAATGGSAAAAAAATSTPTTVSNSLSLEDDDDDLLLHDAPAPRHVRRAATKRTRR